MDFLDQKMKTYLWSRNYPTYLNSVSLSLGTVNTAMLISALTMPIDGCATPPPPKGVLQMVCT